MMTRDTMFITRSSPGTARQEKAHSPRQLSSRIQKNWPDWDFTKPWVLFPLLASAGELLRWSRKTTALPHARGQPQYWRRTVIRKLQRLLLMRSEKELDHTCSRLGGACKEGESFG